MKQHMQESLTAGIIRPLIPPAEAVFFYDEEKQLINYWGLIQIIIKNRNPLPLINSVFEQRHLTKIFSKLELRKKNT